MFVQHLLFQVLRVPTGSFGDALNSSSPSERVTPEAVVVSESQHPAHIFKDLRGEVSCLRIKCAQLERNRVCLIFYAHTDTTV